MVNRHQENVRTSSKLQKSSRLAEKLRLVETVYCLSVQLPASEQRGLISRMRRAAVSIPSAVVRCSS
jgi:four helix bundle protein